jgi:hypothetical protein
MAEVAIENAWSIRTSGVANEGCVLIDTEGAENECRKGGD